MYRTFFRTFLLRVSPETAHRLAILGLRSIGRVPGALRLIRRMLNPSDPALAVQAFGLEFSNPLGVAGGMDKNAEWFDELGSLGFGAVEVGTVTAEPQPGNSGTRVWRRPSDRAVVNRMGFPNEGAEIVARRLRRKPSQTLIGVNIGKSRATPICRAHEDYGRSTRSLAGAADFLVLNISSPNTPGLRGMQTADHVRVLVDEVRTELQSLQLQVPVLLKIGPDLTDREVESVADAALELKLDGVVATNTLVERNAHTRSWPEGGISGAPLKDRALAVLELLYARIQGEIPLIAVGGIETAEDAWQRVLAGATLLQAHTGFVYGGPLWPRRVNRGIAERVRDSGFVNVEQAVGSGVRTVQQLDADVEPLSTKSPAVASRSRAARASV